jgi:hypothetical protein
MGSPHRVAEAALRDMTGVKPLALGWGYASYSTIARAVIIGMYRRPLPLGSKVFEPIARNGGRKLAGFCYYKEYINHLNGGHPFTKNLSTIRTQLARKLHSLAP